MSVTAAEGFVASGCHAGIKRRRHDMALLATEDRQPVACAAVFTQNKFVAPPVELDRAQAGRQWRPAAAIVVNSRQRQCRHRRAGPRRRRGDGRGRGRGARHRDEQHMLVCSTGIIGTPLPMDVILAAIPELGEAAVARRRARMRRSASSPPTSTAKQAVVRGSTFTLGGMAKGCGMIAPNMATMLAFLTTDADGRRASCCSDRCATRRTRTFNTLNVDGATSTNDTRLAARQRPRAAGPTRRNSPTRCTGSART